MQKMRRCVMMLPGAMVKEGHRVDPALSFSERTRSQIGVLFLRPILKESLLSLFLVSTFLANGKDGRRLIASVWG